MQSQAYTALYYMEDCCADITVLIPRDHTFPYITCQSPPSQSTSAGYKSALPEIIFNCKLDISKLSPRLGIYYFSFEAISLKIWH